MIVEGIDDLEYVVKKIGEEVMGYEPTCRIRIQRIYFEGEKKC